jgi:hypothetical protein
MTLQTNHLTGFGGTGASGFTASAVVFDGTNDYMTRAADFTSNSDGKTGILSFWIKYNGGDGGNQCPIWSDAGPTHLCRRDNLNEYYVYFRNAALANRIGIVSNSAWTVSSGWHHVLSSWDASVPNVHLYINGADDEDTGYPTIKVDDTLDYTLADHHFMADNNGNQKVNADVAEFYMAFNQYVDITQSANRLKFRTADGKPANLGADGSAATGSAPTLYCSVRPGDAASVFGNNRGTGGGLTITGSLTSAATSPSD